MIRLNMCGLVDICIYPIEEYWLLLHLRDFRTLTHTVLSWVGRGWSPREG